MDGLRRRGYAKQMEVQREVAQQTRAHRGREAQDGEQAEIPKVGNARRRLKIRLGERLEEQARFGFSEAFLRRGRNRHKPNRVIARPAG